MKNQIPINQDDNLQPRYLVNLQNISVFVFPNNTESIKIYLKERRKPNILEQEIKPYSYIWLPHAYFILSCPSVNKFSMRECFDKEDLDKTIRSLHKGLL